jgi:hypothetical protein
MSQYSQPPQWDPRYGPPPNAYSPPYSAPGNYSQLPPRSKAPAIIGLGIILGTLIGLAIDLFVVDPLSGVFNLARAPIEWLRLLCYNLPLALGASVFVSLTTR